MKDLCALALAAACMSSLGTGCDRKEARADPAPASTVAVAAPAVDTTGPLGPGETLMGRLSKEGRERPGVAPTAEDVFAAFDRLGASVPQREQTLGATYKAAYCVGGYTADRTLAINVCEYGNEGAATAGRDLSRSLFPDLPSRDVWRRKATTLSIIEQKRDDATIALQKKLVSAFLAL